MNSCRIHIIRVSKLLFVLRLGRGRYGVVFVVEDLQPDDGSPTLYAMKIQRNGEEYQRELKILCQLNSDRIIRPKTGCHMLK